MVLKKVGPLSCAKLSGALYGVMGLMFGAIVSLISLLGIGLGQMGNQAAGGVPSLIFGVGAVVFIPVLYGALGFVLGLITAGLYNWIARGIGGLQVELE